MTSVASELLAAVSTLYYLDGRTQAEIAARFELSRPKVSRLLHAARTTGIARIAVNPPRDTFVGLETELEGRFALPEVRVVPVPSGGSTDGARRQLGAAAAADLARSVRPGHVVGLTGGALVAAMVDAVAPRVTTDVRVVQGLGWERSPTAPGALMALVSELARRLDGAAVVLPAPSVVASEAVRRGLAADPHIGAALHALDTPDTVYLEIRPGVASATHAVGHLALRHLDGSGRMLGARVDGHVVGITTEQLRRARHVVALARGPAHAPAIAAALRTRLVRTLIIDEHTARALAADGGA